MAGGSVAGDWGVGGAGATSPAPGREGLRRVRSGRAEPPRGWLLVGLLPVATLSLAACWTTVRPERPIPQPMEPEETSPEVAATPAGSASAPIDADGQTPAPPPAPEVAVGELPIPRVEMSEVPGAGALSQRYVPTVRQHLEACGGKKGDVVQVALVTQDGDILARLEESNTSATVGACVVNKVAMDLEYYLSPSQSPSERLEDVQSVLTIRW